ncbi:hypothetical protein [Flavobacterium sp. UBA6135]|uniref:hypothetical protein n=1 Tax=Flavobacterium sp. UBA6135 TaxID=1946553 RepID=UPI0025C13E51|nr:hypothetical protein [Flavobacterium sp. UBA6135]
MKAGKILKYFFLLIIYIILINCNSKYETELSKIKVFLSQNEKRDYPSDAIEVISIKKTKNKMQIDCYYLDIFNAPSKTNANVCFFNTKILYNHELSSYDNVLNNLKAGARIEDNKSYFNVDLSYNKQDNLDELNQLFEKIIDDFNKSNYGSDLMFFIYFYEGRNYCFPPPPPAIEIPVDN